jgi:hypothetical protein
VQTIVVGESESFVAKLGGAEDDLIDVRCPIEEGEVGVGVKFDVCHQV